MAKEITRATEANIRKMRGLGFDYYVIWSNEHGMYWKPGECGYSGSLNMAGLYAFDKAEKICIEAGMMEDGRPAETMVHMNFMDRGAGQ